MLYPKVSIIIPVYNGSNYLSEAIDSALNQVYENIEILVINDGSNDQGKTEKIALSYGEKIRYFNKENGGVSSALNLGIKNANGEYISWLSHDDLYSPDKISEQIAFLGREINSDELILSSNYELVNQNGTLISIVDSSYQENELLYKLIIRSFLNGCTLLIPKKAFLEIGFFETELKTSQDYHLWFKMMKKFKFKNVNYNLVKSRQHDNQDTKTKNLLVLWERIKLEYFIFNLFSTEEIWISSGSNLNKYLFIVKLVFSLLKTKFIMVLIMLLKSLGIYNMTLQIFNLLKLK